MILSRRAALAAGAATLAMPSVARAATFPAKPIRIIVPYPPGGPTDQLARLVAGELQAMLGQQVLIENKPGASGAIGTREAAKAEADGHTLVLGNNQTHAINSFLMKEPGYDPLKDFVPIAGLADLQHVLVVKNDLAAKSVAELVALAKSKPGALNYGSTGPGSGSHLTMELFKTKAGIDAVHVPFRGAAPLAQEIVAGRIDLAFPTFPSVLGQIQGGTMRALAMASSQRAPQLPDLATLKELGIAGSEADSWLALFAPAKVPADVQATLAKAVLEIMGRPATKEASLKFGMVVNTRAPADMAPYVTAEIAKWSEVARSAKVEAQ